jgi:molecular chaperone GrpE
MPWESSRCWPKGNSLIHLHEAVVTEPTDDYEPDTVMQEIVRGFRVGDKLIRPSLVKVAVKK